MFTFFNRNVYLYTIFFTRQCVVHSFVIHILIPSCKIQCEKIDRTCHEPVSQVWLELVFAGGRGAGGGGAAPTGGRLAGPVRRHRYLLIIYFYNIYITFNEPVL